MTLRANQIAGLARAIDTLTASTSPADAELHRFFRDHPAMGQQDRALVAEGTFAWLRRRRSLEALAGTTSPHRLALAVLTRELGHSVRELEPVLSANDVAWIAAFRGRLASALPDAVAHELPDWLWQRLCDHYGASEASRLAQALAQPAPLDIRVNTLRSNRERVQRALAESGIPSVATPYSPLGLRLQGRPALNRASAFEAGEFEVQDEASQLVGFVVSPRRTDMVVDFCAGAGGKSLLLGALMRSQGRLYAFDVSERRLAKLKPRLARSGLSNVHPQVIANERDVRVKRLAGKIDRVLVDAPCTGFGTLRRNPDLKWRQSPDGLDALMRKQASILRGAAALVKAGGRLVYATCSVLPEENERIVEAFLADRPDFELLPVAPELRRAGIPLDTGDTLNLMPHRHGCDGFFAAALVRVGQDTRV